MLSSMLVRWGWEEFDAVRWVIFKSYPWKIEEDTSKYEQKQIFAALAMKICHLSRLLCASGCAAAFQRRK